jgi:hypothetical protein
VNQQKIRNVLEDTPIFLPITHAQVYTIATGNREKLPFVAVNKEHILALEEEYSASKGAHKPAEINYRRIT